METTNTQAYIKYARKEGLLKLKYLIETLKDPEAIKAANNAYKYWDGKLRSDRYSRKGRYKL